MKRRVLPAFLLLLSTMAVVAETRETNVDFVLLVDTSLSMADAIADARRYAASEIIGRLAEPGDWVTIVSFYGKTEVVWQGDIRSPEDTAAVVRSLNLLEATGRFTDIGAALDAMDALLLARGLPERPKYVVLLTDERQEAPQDSSYYSTDYTVQHPLLEYVKREDRGTFRIITIGYGLAAKVEGQARSMMTTLTEPPARPQIPLPGSSAEQPAEQGAGSSTDTEAASSAPAASGSEPAGTATTQPGTDGGFSGAPIAAGVAAAGAAGVLLALLAGRKRKRARKDEKKPPLPKGQT